MAIKGLTDRPIMRRDGKIRSGFKEMRNGREVPMNADHFLLHDAAPLIPVLGEKPSEIYFTVYFDDINAVAPNDLRYYTKSDLQCLGNAETAAYMGTNEVPGLRQEQGYLMDLMERNTDGSGRKVLIPRSRLRNCAYKACPEYLAGHCSEHIRLDVVVPQYSMGSMWTLENTSINGLLNIIGALDKTRLANIHRGGKISGEIFRLYKEKVSLAFENAKTGQRSRSDRDVVHMEHVPFPLYEEKFKAKCPRDSWEALMALRSGSLILPNGQIQISGPADIVALPSPEGIAQAAALPPPSNDEEILKARANDPAVLALFEEIAKLKGVPNTEEKRIATAKIAQDVPALVAKLKAAIAKTKKDMAQAAQAAAPVVPPEAVQTPAAVIAAATQPQTTAPTVLF